MLLVPGLSSYGFTFDNWGTNPTATALGTAVTPGASNAEGTFTQIASSANIAQDCYWLWVRVSGGAGSTAQKDHLLDIGVDPAGGTSYTAVISNAVCGETNTLVAQSAGAAFMFPLFIKAGSSVAARVQGSNATAGSVLVGAKFWGQPSRPEAVPAGMFSETIGTITNSGGVSFTPGNAADGTWVDLGTTTKAMWWWQLGYEISNATITAEQTYIELAFGDGSNKHIILRAVHVGSAAEVVQDVVLANLMFPACYWPVPAGAHIYVRGRCNNAPDTGYNAVAIGIGG